MIVAKPGNNYIVRDGEYIISGSWSDYYISESWNGLINNYNYPSNVINPSSGIGDKYECHFCGTQYNKIISICERCGGNKLSLTRVEISRQSTRKLLRMEKTDGVDTIYYKLYYSDYSYEIIYFSVAELLNVAEYRDTKDYIVEVLSRASGMDNSNLRRIFCD